MTGRNERASKKTARALGFATVVIGAVVVLGVLTFAGPCVHEDGSTSTCATAGMAVLWGGLGVVLFGLLATAAVSRGHARAVSIVAFASAAVAALLVVLAPGTLFPLCMMATMRCQAVMRPFAHIAGVLATATSVAGLGAGVRGR